MWCIQAKYSWIYIIRWTGDFFISFIICIGTKLYTLQCEWERAWMYKSRARRNKYSRLYLKPGFIVSLCIMCDNLESFYYRRNINIMNVNTKRNPAIFHVTFRYLFQYCSHYIVHSFVNTLNINSSSCSHSHVNFSRFNFIPVSAGWFVDRCAVQSKIGICLGLNMCLHPIATVQAV